MCPVTRASSSGVTSNFLSVVLLRWGGLAAGIYSKGSGCCSHPFTTEAVLCYYNMKKTTFQMDFHDKVCCQWLNQSVSVCVCGKPAVFWLLRHFRIITLKHAWKTSCALVVWRSLEVCDRGCHASETFYSATWWWNSQLQTIHQRAARVCLNINK